MTLATDADLRSSIEALADQLCMAVDGTFDFSVKVPAADESLQKLQMLVNFVLDAARRGLTALEDQNRQLAELDRLKSEFLANVSHELRTPLTLILAPLETLLADAAPSLPDDVQNELRRIQRNAWRLHTLVSDLLDFAKLESGRMAPDWESVDLVELIQKTVHDTQALATRKGIQLSVRCDVLAPMATDARMCEKIVLNLLSNALKFTPSGGRVDVRLHAADDHVELSVTDTGPGIPEDQLPRLFQRFVQAEGGATRKHEGTGIGLALVREFAELLGGSAGVESRLGHGSRFFVRLPQGADRRTSLAGPMASHDGRHAPVPWEAALEPSSSTSVQGQQDACAVRGLSSPADNGLPKLIVADDNADMRDYMRDLLKSEFDVVAVENGRLALDAARAHRPQIVISDVMMPEMDGLELVARLKQDPTLRDIHVILVTARASREAIVGGLDCGADDYLGKPFGPTELRARVRAARRSCQMYRELADKTAALETEVQQRKRAEVEREEMYRRLLEASRRAGMADVATSVLHNVGNVLNSVNVSASIVTTKVRSSPAQDLARVSNLLHTHEQDLAGFLTRDAKGRKVPRFLDELSRHLMEEQRTIVEEMESLGQSIEHLKTIVAMQQSYARVAGVVEDVSPTDLVEDAVRINGAALQRHKIELVRDYQETRVVRVDRHTVLQVLVNLISNAKYAISRTARKDGCLRLRVVADGEHLRIEVHDNGEGIPPENLTRIFAHGYTTKKDGHGFGLHSSAIAAKELGGTLTAHSEGVGRGATFVLRLPLSKAIVAS